MKARALVLLLVVAVFAGAVVMFPETSEMKASRLAQTLPMTVGDWLGKPQEPGAREKKILAQDTEFERMMYFDPTGKFSAIETSIVFSGKNLSQSIHRPEVCLRAQGWEFISERYLMWSDILLDQEALPVKELICRQVYRIKNENDEFEDLLLENGKKAYIWRAFYYTFIGHDKIVAGHYQRTAEDIKDRLFQGYDQRWAYVTFSSFITKKHADQGIGPRGVTLMDEEETEAHIVQFLKELTPIVISPPGEGKDQSLEISKG